MIENIMTKKVLLFVVFFCNCFLTGVLFAHSFNPLTVQTPIVIQLTAPISKNPKTSAVTNEKAKCKEINGKKYKNST